MLRIRAEEGAADRTRPIPPPPAGVPRHAGSRIELTDVCWSGGLDQPLAVDRVTFDLDPGSHLGIAGASASGKTVITHLLTGLKRPTRGTVLIDGCPPSELPTATAVLIERVGAVFDATVRDNLLLGAPLPDVALRAALRDVRLWDELSPRGGLDLVLSQGGAELSGGQLSRLNLTRALLRRPSLLVIDEALDSVELPLEAQIRSLVRRRGTCSTKRWRRSMTRSSGS
jgi:ABC-type multidrug transport system fused ATPase/permease subunit